MPLPQATVLAPLQPSDLRRICDAADLGFSSTAELAPIEDLIGQERALQALDFGARIAHDGFNIFALGPTRSGRHGAIRQRLEQKASKEAVPDDWIYVNNFVNPDRPKAIRLPSGVGTQLKTEMVEVIDELSAALPTAFESEDYRNRRRAVDSEFESEQEQSFDALRKKALAQNIGILRTPMGFALAPLGNGQVIKPEIFNALPEQERKEVEGKIGMLQAELEQILRNVPVLERNRRHKIRKLNAEVAEMVVDQLIGEVSEKFADEPEIVAYLAEVRSDLIENVEMLLKPQAEEAESSFDLGRSNHRGNPAFRRYAVNVLVSHFGSLPEGAGDRGAPVVCEEHPTLARLLGHIDHRSMMGTLVTDFTMIKAGALHFANGGYLVLDAFKVLREPLVWDALKRCMRSKMLQITSAADEFGLITTVTLMPDAIPLNVKIVLVGEPLLYYLLFDLDPDFATLFKVQADFEEETERTPETVNLLARLLATIARREKLLPLTAESIARLIEQASRESADAERLTLRVGILADLLREAGHWARAEGTETIEERHVEKAIDEARHRSERLRDRSLENINRNLQMIDTDGEVIGQINGLSVMTVGSLSFGKPTRITARVRMGTGKVVDIEREVELGGPIHSKGVLILSSYLATHFALSLPMSLWASLVFEQSYGGVEGDSASSAELYALLSALAGVPIRQSFAVTGSVNQLGQIQAIGGVNEKIEGFFDICKFRGLTGRQAVIIPEANRRHLMLRREVVEAAEHSRFHVYAVSSINEGISLLTGLPAGTRGKDGAFPPDSVNGLVEATLVRFAEARRSYGKSSEDNERGKKGSA